MIKLNKKSQKILLIILPILLVISVIAIIISNNNKRQDSYAENEPIEYTYRKVYLNSKDDTLVPLTIKYQKKDNLGDEIHYVLNLIKENSGISNDVFTGLIPEDSKIKSLDLEDNNLTINFDIGFQEYAKEEELRLLQQLVWTMTEFNEVDSLTLQMEDEILTNMPVKNTPLAEKTGREIGINSFYLTSADFLSSEKVLSYYAQEIDNKEYIVPFTHYVKNNANLTLPDLTIKTLLTKPSITSQLNLVPCLNEVNQTAASVLEDDVLMVSLNENILFDEKTVNKEVYDILRASLELCEDVKDVSFVFDQEVFAVNGQENLEEIYPVSSIYFNEYYI